MTSSPTFPQFNHLYPQLAQYIGALQPMDLGNERRKELEPGIAYCRKKLEAGEPLRLHFICTHNSRRSQMAQAWAGAMAYTFGIPIEVFSGGTEVTAFHPNAVGALENCGFEIARGAGNNPIYQIKYAPDQPPLEMFSKVIHHPSNPTQGFVAVLTCTDADEACPIVSGAEFRWRLPYIDPKIADGTPEELSAYHSTCLTIATEWLYVFLKLTRG